MAMQVAFSNHPPHTNASDRSVLRQLCGAQLSVEPFAPIQSGCRLFWPGSLAFLEFVSIPCARRVAKQSNSKSGAWCYRKAPVFVLRMWMEGMLVKEQTMCL